jgi:hypothetical protein
MADKKGNKMGSAIKDLWRKSGSSDSLKEFARSVARDKDHYAQAVAQTWLDNKSK